MANYSQWIGLLIELPKVHFISGEDLTAAQAIQRLFFLHKPNTSFRGYPGWVSVDATLTDAEYRVRPG